MEIKNVIGDYEMFIKDLLTHLQNRGIEVGDFAIDHCCYRVETVEEFEVIKKELLSFSSEWVENIHHGRPIAKFILKEPLIIGKYSIPVIELPSPATNRHFISGLEHIEFAIGYNFIQFRERYHNLWSGKDDSGPFNQTVYIRFESGKTAKFHEHPLLEVLKLEGVILTKLANSV